MFYLLFRALLFVILLRFTKSVRLSVVYNYLLSSVAILVGMFLLSLSHDLTAGNYHIYSFLLFIGTGLVALMYTDATATAHFLIDRAKAYWRNLELLPRLLVGSLAFILIVTAGLGVIAPPNNHDAMTATMARLIFWVGNKSVAFYPTSELPQLNLGPFASYKFLNNFFITNNDYLIHLVQWEAMVVTLIVISLIAQKFKFNHNQEVLSVFIAATVPMGVMQATSAQNDYVVTSYVILVFYFFIDYLLKNKISVPTLFWIGLCLGLAVLSKATSYIYLIGLGVLVAMKILRDWKHLIKNVFLFMIIPLMIVTINSYQFYENYHTFGHFAGSLNEMGFKYTNDKMDLQTVAVNFSRNILLNVTIPSIYWNEKANAALKQILSTLKIDFNNPANTWDTRESFRFRQRLRDENFTGNQLHLLLIFISLIIVVRLFLKKRLPLAKELGLLIIPASFSFLIFCLLLKWQPWHTRLHMVYFILFSPLIAYVLTQVKDVTKRTTLQVGVCLLLFLITWPSLFNNNTKHVTNGQLFTLSREQQYFISGISFGYDKLLPLASRAKEKGCDHLNLVLADNEYEYPLWAAFDFKVNIQHALVNNETKRFVPMTTAPGKHCYVVSKDRGDHRKVMNTIALFANREDFGNFTLVD